jgi:1,4-alpha-glucan branching enzyme
MLAQASDWPFLISMGQSARYSEVRLVKHIHRTQELIRQIDAKSIDPKFLSTLEGSESLLGQDMDYRVFCRA